MHRVLEAIANRLRNCRTHRLAKPKKKHKEPITAEMLKLMVESVELTPSLTVGSVPVGLCRINVLS